MSIELIGFLAGFSAVLGATFVLASHEQWKAIRSAYTPATLRQRAGNALIWPSR
ncbi:MAG: hypothetical protein ACREDX_08070 [Aestuariivirga sp.]